MKRSFIKRHTKLCAVTVLLGFCLISASLYFVLSKLEFSSANSEQVYSGESYKDVYDGEDEFTYYNGEKYKYNKKLQTVLFMGVDKSVNNSESTGFRNGGQCDVLFLTAINKKTKQYTVIQINRDTMTNINVLGESGKITGTAKAQIALSYAYGDGKKKSCENTVDAVEKLLMGIKIDNYFSASVDSVPYFNDLVGGVPVIINDDFSKIDKSLVKGKTITLTGKQAYEFIRYRRDVSDQTNISRMARHRQYAQSFIDTLYKEFNKNASSASRICNGILSKTITDMSNSEVLNLANNSANFKRNDILIPDGTIDDSKEFVEFNANENSITDIVLSVFYEKADDKQ